MKFVRSVVPILLVTLLLSPAIPSATSLNGAMECHDHFVASDPDTREIVGKETGGDITGGMDDPNSYTEHFADVGNNPIIHDNDTSTFAINVIEDDIPDILYRVNISVSLSHPDLSELRISITESGTEQRKVILREPGQMSSGFSGDTTLFFDSTMPGPVGRALENSFVNKSGSFEWILQIEDTVEDGSGGGSSADGNKLIMFRLRLFHYPNDPKTMLVDPHNDVAQNITGCKSPWINWTGECDVDPHPRLLYHVKIRKIGEGTIDWVTSDSPGLKMEFNHGNSSMVLIYNDTTIRFMDVKSPMGTYHLSVVTYDGIKLSRGIFSDMFYIQNTIPDKPEVSLVPQVARAKDNISAIIERPSMDPDQGDPVYYIYQWHLNDQPVEAVTGDTLPADLTHKNDRVMCIVRASDGFEEGEPVTSPVLTIENSPPTISWIEPRMNVQVTNTIMLEWAGWDPDHQDKLSVDLLYHPVDDQASVKVIEEGQPGTGSYQWDLSGVENQRSYFVVGRISDGEEESMATSPGAVEYKNDEPTLGLLSPSETQEPADDKYTITWDDGDDGDGAVISLFYLPSEYSFIYPDGSGSSSDMGTVDGSSSDVFSLNPNLMIIIENIAQEDPANQHDWDTSNLPPGEYRVIGSIDDGINPTLWSEPQGTVLVSHGGRPSLKIIDPDGRDDQADSQYIIHFQADDPDSEAQIRLFWDIDDRGYDGTEITGEPLTEGYENTYTWYTGDMAEGSYFVYGSISDGQEWAGNTEIFSDYSQGPVSVKHSQTNTAPTFEFTVLGESDETASTAWKVQWEAYDPNDDASIYIFYDEDDSGYDGTQITTETELDGTGSFDWDLTGFNDGDSFYLYAIVTDTKDSTQTYTDHRLIIDHGELDKPDPVSLQTPEEVGDSWVKLSWTEYTGDDFLEYQVFVIQKDKVLGAGTRSELEDFNANEWMSRTHNQDAIFDREKTETTVDGLSPSTNYVVFVAVMADSELRSPSNVFEIRTTDSGTNQPPIASLPSTHMVVTAGQTMTLNGAGEDQDGEVSLYEWNFNGESDQWVSTSSSTVEHTFNEPGTYTVLFRVRDNNFVASEPITMTVDVQGGGDAVEGEGENDNAEKDEDEEFNWDLLDMVIGIIIVIFTGILGIIQYNRMKKKKKTLKQYLAQLRGIYNNYRYDPPLCEKQLVAFKDLISRDFEKDRIEENHYLILDKKVDDRIKATRKEMIRSSTGDLPGPVTRSLERTLDDGRVSRGEMKTVMATVRKSPEVSSEDEAVLRRHLMEWMKRDRGMSYPRELREEIMKGRIKSLPREVELEVRSMLDDGVVTRDEYNRFRARLESQSGMTDADKRSTRDLVAAWMREDKKGRQA